MGGRWWEGGGGKGWRLLLIIEKRIIENVNETHLSVFVTQIDGFDKIDNVGNGPRLNLRGGRAAGIGGAGEPAGQWQALVGRAAGRWSRWRFLTPRRHQ